jgi:hypothetical protein
MSKASKNQGFSAGRALGLATSRADAVEEENATLRARLAALTAAPPPAPPAPVATPPASPAPPALDPLDEARKIPHPLARAAALFELQSAKLRGAR